MIPAPTAFAVFQPYDNLFARRSELEQTQSIESLEEYALDWQRLAADFDKAGLLSNANYCRSRGKHYSLISEAKPGEYVRLIDGPFSELIEVEA